jgi:hypothetical protein
MQPHLAEILSKAWLEEGAARGIERLARRPQNFVHNARNSGCRSHARSLPTQNTCLVFMFLLARIAFSAAGAGTLQHRSRERLRLHRTAQHPQQGLVSNRPLQTREALAVRRRAITGGTSRTTSMQVPNATRIKARISLSLFAGCLGHFYGLAGWSRKHLDLVSRLNPNRN